MASQPSDELEPALTRVREAQAAGRISGDGAANLLRWLTEPQYAAYRPAILEAVAAGAWAELDGLFWEVIPFGTGGRRGTMAAFGSATINERTIAESADGMAVYLRETRGQPGGTAVIAHDTRHRSREFAELSARVFAGRGLKVFLFDSHRSTPALSFAVRHLGCDIGVMISASHNPPSDNGFKAYWSSGGQVLPPHDKGIIARVYSAREIPMADFHEAVASGQVELIGEAVDAAYVAAVAELSLSDAREIPAIFTPLHGVGETSVYRVLQSVGFYGVSIFEPQRRPDPDFSNVPDRLPNPEREEVFGPAVEQAKKSGAELVLASDPDADRLGVMVRSQDGRFVHLTGNRIGALLTDYVVRKRSAAGTLSDRHYVVETLVTTPLIAAIARAHGLRVIDDLLVGFKYIGQTMDQEGPARFVFGAEESLGYLAGQYCRDKDAAVAALYLLESAAELRRDGKTLLDRLDELFAQHGYFVESQVSQVRRGPSGKQQIDQILKAFREQPPERLGDVTLERVTDYGEREVRELPKNKRVEAIEQPQGNLLILEGRRDDSRFRIAVRPSGTEPKIKYYFFAQSPCDHPDRLPAIQRETEATLRGLETAVVAWVNTAVPEA